MFKIKDLIKQLLSVVLFSLTVLSCVPAMATSTCNSSNGGKAEVAEA